MVSLEHKPAPVIQGDTFGSALTKVVVDTGNHKIQLWINGTKVEEWS